MAILPNDLDTMAYSYINTLAFIGCFRAGELVSMPSKLGYECPLIQDLTFGCFNANCSYN